MARLKVKFICLITATVFCMYVGITYLGPKHIPSKLNQRQAFNKLPSQNFTDRKPILKQGFGSTPSATTKVRHQMLTHKPQPKTWNRPRENPKYFIRRTVRVTPVDFKFLITSDICKGGSTYLVIMVVSMASHLKYRDAIRETWGGVNHKAWAGTTLSQEVRLIFLFGVPANNSETIALKKEASQHHDIVLADFKEAYFNLTYKVLMGFRWVKQYCNSAKYVMKNDEDSIVHIPWLLERLQLPEWNTSIVGPYFENEMHQTLGKFRVDSEMYPFRVYPPHVKGNVYIMQTNLAYRILEVSEYMPYVNMEDAHITGILPKVIGAAHYKRIPSNEYSPHSRPGVCDIAKRKKFAGRDLSADYVKEVWEKVLKPESCR